MAVLEVYALHYSFNYILSKLLFIWMSFLGKTVVL